MKGGKFDSILSMIYSGPGNVVDVPPPVAVAQVQVTAVRRHRHRRHQIQVLVHQGQVRSLGLVLHRGLGSHSRNEGRGKQGCIVLGVMWITLRHILGVSPGFSIG